MSVSEGATPPLANQSPDFQQPRQRSTIGSLSGTGGRYTNAPTNDVSQATASREFSNSTNAFRVLTPITMPSTDTSSGE